MQGPRRHFKAEPMNRAKVEEVWHVQYTIGAESVARKCPGPRIAPSARCPVHGSAHHLCRAAGETP